MHLTVPILDKNHLVIPYLKFLVSMVMHFQTKLKEDCCCGHVTIMPQTYEILPQFICFSCLKNNCKHL